MKHSKGPWKTKKTILGRTIIIDQNQKVLGSLIEPYDSALAAAAPEMLRLLQDLEWAGFYSHQPVLGKLACPACGRPKPNGHADGCKLAALLRRLE